MKNWVKVLSILFLLSLIFLVKNIEATSGCCSGHDGVNCSAGAQSSGNVICNDGWRGSSCSYSEMVMCGGSLNNNSSTVQTAPPTSIPQPTTAIPTATRIPTKIPTPKPTSTPTLTPTLIPTILPTETLTPTPTSTSTPTPTPTLVPTNSPQVLGIQTTDNEKSSSNSLGTLAILAWLTFGGYKLVKKFKNKQ